MDEAAAIAFLDEFLALLVENETVYDTNHEHYYRDSRWQPLQERINAVLLGARRIAERVEPGLVAQLVANPGLYTWEWKAARDATHQIRGAIEQRERVEAILAPARPRLSASQLHPWVWDAAVKLWDGGHFRAALQTAGSSIDAQLQAKLGRYDISGSDLVTQAFRLDPPKPNDPRLRFEGFVEGSDVLRTRLNDADSESRFALHRRA
jgi:Protein of unknown function (Hypoth_ymh)